mmetsp:Transcript_24055/g.21071  ORF Transcript_24055/g.21071 Transcript_24055/m.21071 type:complete len:204 (-) Transcript_24055:2239-2850(-)
MAMLQDNYPWEKVPADIDLAETHGKAKMIYVSKAKDSKEEVGREVCHCCNLPVDGELIGYCDELSNLFHLGSAYALYFRFLKYCMGLLICVLVVHGIFSMASNVAENDCPQNIEDVTQFCVDGSINNLTLANKRDNEETLRVHLILCIVTVLIIVLFFHYIRYRVRKTDIEADDQTITPSDFTVMLKGVPPETDNASIREFIE